MGRTMMRHTRFFQIYVLKERLYVRGKGEGNDEGEDNDYLRKPVLL